MQREHFTTPKNYPTEADAMQARNRRAKELRAQGYTVKCSAVSFAGFGYGKDFLVEYQTKAEQGV